MHFHSGPSNGFTEAINGRIQSAKARAKGHDTDGHPITISHLINVNLEHLPKTPWLAPHSTGGGMKVSHTDRERARNGDLHFCNFRKTFLHFRNAIPVSP